MPPWLWPASASFGSDVSFGSRCSRRAKRILEQYRLWWTRPHHDRRGARRTAALLGPCVLPRPKLRPRAAAIGRDRGGRRRPSEGEPGRADRACDAASGTVCHAEDFRTRRHATAIAVRGLPISLRGDYVLWREVGFGGTDAAWLAVGVEIP